MQRLLLFCIFPILMISCTSTQKTQIIFNKYNQKVDTISFERIKNVITYIKPQTLYPLNESGFHIGGSSFTSRIYIIDFKNQVVADSLQLDATNAHSIFYAAKRTYLYNSTVKKLYRVSYIKKIDTAFIGTYDFSLSKNEYAANYNERKILCPDSTGFSVVVAYGDNNSRAPNYLGDCIFKLMPETHKPFGKYLSADYKYRKIFRSVIFDMDAAGNILYCPEMADRLMKINTAGQVKAEIKFSNYKAPAYDKGKNGDLAYLRKYEAGVEFNCDLGIVNQYVYLLKRKAKMKLQTPDMYDLFIFDVYLNPVAKLSNLPDLVPFIAKDQNAIFLLNMKRNEIYKIQ